MSRRQPASGTDEAQGGRWRVVICAPTPLSARAEQLAWALRQSGALIEVAQRPDAAADLVIWTEPRSRTEPFGAAVNVVDLHGIADPAVLAQCRGAALLLAGSEAEHGVWSAAGATAGLSIPVAVVAYAVPVRPRAQAAFRTLLILQGAAPLNAVSRATAWAAAKGIACGVADPRGAAGLRAIQLTGAAPAAGLGTVVLDARLDGPPDVPPRLVEALASGAPVLGCSESPLMQRLVASGAAIYADPLEARLDHLATLPPASLQAMSDAARAFAQRWFDPAEAAAALLGAVHRAVSRTRARNEAWMQRDPGLGPGGHVLVISDEALNLVDIRIHLPFAALHRRGAIDGYTVLRHGEIAFSTGSPDRFDMIWVHRSVDTGVQLLLQVLGRPFVYDVDDNLLVSPSYRAAFPAETMETAHALLRQCTILSCATPTLFQLLQRHSALPLAGKAVVTPNLAQGAPLPIQPGRPRAVIWASSDKPALTGSRPEVERAVRDFCQAHKLGLVCLGAAPPKVLAESGLPIEHPGLLSYPAYLARLRSLSPSILVCPLETGADPATQDFVDGKSDVKVIEARLCGLIGVFSRALPYLESDLEPAILCGNDYASWLDGLERALQRCGSPGPATRWPRHRTAELLGPKPWAEALAEARLAEPVTLREVLAGVQFVRAQQSALRDSREFFDEEYYLTRHEDVRLAVQQGIVGSGYEHYRIAGFAERRAARRRQTPEGQADAWWASLMHTIGRVEADTTARAAEIEGLRARLALRRTQQPRPIPAETPEAPVPAAHPSIDLVWHPPGAVCDQPCPVCDAPGPHPVLLRADAETLIRCRACASCFYEHRIVYDYEREKDADVLQQLYLEQNASIYHQTRFLFAIDEAVDSVLDVGCGFGYPVDVAAKVLGWRATGIDPSFYAREGAALLRADIRKDYLTEQTDLGEPFGLVMASEVIEHVPDPYAFLALLRRWLKPGGTLVLTTPSAASLTPSLGPGSLIGILALKVHLILFNQDSLASALRRAGFRHVQVRAEQDGLVAYASDQPLRFRADAAERHVQAYKRYLEHLVETAEPGSALWNGGAGRLFTLLAGDAEIPFLQALFARIAAAWREKFGIDLARLRLPKLLDEAAFAATKPADLSATQPLNLATVLFNRAVLEQRTPGRTPEAILGFARPAYLVAVQTRRVLQAEDMIDLELKRIAWRARQLIIDSLAELAPEVEGELLFALAEDSPGALHDRIDLPPDALTARIAGFFVPCVGASRFDEASRVEPWMRDLDAVCSVLAGDKERLFRALFTVGVQRLVHDHALGPALQAFERLELETRLLLDDPAEGDVARQFFRVAQKHVQLVAARFAPEST